MRSRRESGVPTVFYKEKKKLGDLEFIEKHNKCYATGGELGCVKV